VSPLTSFWLGRLSVTPVQRVVTVALAVILFDGEMRSAGLGSAEPLARVARTVRPAKPRPIGRLAPLLPVPAVADLAVPTDPTRLPA